MKKVKLMASKVNHYPYKESNHVEITERQIAIDGYHIAERLLEGLIFVVTFNEQGKVTNIGFQDKYDEEYFENFNKEKYFNMIKDHVTDLVDEGEEVELPLILRNKYMVDGRNCVYIKCENNDTKKEQPQAQPMKIGKVKL